jgi:hypothetical protein
MNDAPKASASGRSISFNPATLYDWAETYGNSQEPKMSVSAVICTALKEFKTRIEPADTQEAQLLAAGRRIGLPKALEALASHRAKRK